MAYYRERYSKLNPNKKKLLNLQIDQQFATLTIKSFSPSRIRKQGQSFLPFIRQSFKLIKDKEIEYLLIDLRNNGGGNNRCVSQLLEYLLDESILPYKSIEYASMTIDPIPHFAGNPKKGEKWLRANLEECGDRFCVKKDVGLKKLKSKPACFQGNLYILLNGGSYSATGDFMGVLKGRREVRLIGEESGGNPTTNCAGMIQHLTLPHSQLQVQIPMAQFNVNSISKNNGRGILPDVLLTADIQSILSSEDEWLRFAKKKVWEDMAYDSKNQLITTNKD